MNSQSVTLSEANNLDEISCIADAAGMQQVEAPCVKSNAH